MPEKAQYYKNELFLGSSYQYAFPSLSPIVLPLLSPSLTPNGTNLAWHFGPRFYILLHIIGTDRNSRGYKPCLLSTYVSDDGQEHRALHIAIISPSHALSDLREGSE